MNFVNPKALFALFAILIIILLYFLKLKREKKVVSNLFLFNRMLISEQVNRPFRKLRRNLLLLVQILFLLAAIFGLSRPSFVEDIFSNFNYIIIIDSSASMQAVEKDNKSRFDIGKEKSLEIINSFGESDMAMIISADSKTHIRATLTRDKRLLSRTVSALSPSEAPADLYEAFILALSVIKQKKIDKIFVISDGANIGLERLDEEHKIDWDAFPKVEFVSIGEGSDNVGIVDLDINTMTGGDSYQVFAGLQNYSEKKMKADLELYNSGRLIDVKEVEIPAKESLSVIFADLALTKGLLSMKLAFKDALQADNNVFAYMKKPEKVKVLLVSEESLFLENVLSVNPAVSSTLVAPADYDDEGDYSGYDIVIYNMFTPKKAPDTNLFLINTTFSSLGIKKPASSAPGGSVEESPVIIDYDKTHPVMKYVSIDNTAISRANIYEVPDWLQGIVETKRSSIIYAGEKGNRRVILLTFSLNDSDLTLKSSFPIFFYNAIYYLSDRFDKRLSSFYKTGDPVRKRVYGEESVRVTTPDETVIDAKVFNDELFFDDTRSVGLYTIEGPSGYKDFFITNLLDEKESDIMPSLFLTIGGKKIVPTGMIKVRKEYYKHFVLLALLFILLEWWIYHRRVFE